MTIKKKPKVKSVGTVDFNVNTESGKLAYNRALNASKRAGAKTDKAKDAATTEELHGAGNRRVKEAKGSKTNKNKVNWKAAGEALTAGAKVAGHMADKHKEANAGLSSSSAYGNFGAGQAYDTRPHTATRKLNKETDNWEY